MSCDAQPEPRAGHAPCLAHLHLKERLENTRTISGRDADSRVAHGVEHVLADQAHAECYRTLIRELDGVREEVEQNLAQLREIRVAFARSRRNVRHQREPFQRRHRLGEGGHFARNEVRVARLQVNVLASRLESSERQNLIDEREQVLAAAPNACELVVLSLGDRPRDLIDEETREAENGVERRA